MAPNVGLTFYKQLRIAFSPLKILAHHLNAERNWLICTRKENEQNYSELHIKKEPYVGRHIACTFV